MYERNKTYMIYKCLNNACKPDDATEHSATLCKNSLRKLLVPCKFNKFKLDHAYI